MKINIGNNNCNYKKEKNIIIKIILDIIIVLIIAFVIYKLGWNK